MVPLPLLLSVLLAGASVAPAQVPCGPPQDTLAAPPAGAGARLLFQQNGVYFYQVDTGEDERAEVAIAVGNHNPQRVEVSFSLSAQATAAEPGAAREMALGRQCRQLASGQYARVRAPLPHADLAAAAEVRVRHLSITLLSGASHVAAAPAEPSRVSPARAEPAPRAPVPQAEAEAEAAPSEQYWCTEKGPVPAKRACAASFLAASARAAAALGTYSGTTRACLLQFADAQAEAATRARNGGSGEVALPRCYVAGQARWDFVPLSQMCPATRWTPANRGVVSCATLASLERAFASPAAGEGASSPNAAVSAPAATALRAPPELKAEVEPAASERSPYAPLHWLTSLGVERAAVGAAVLLLPRLLLGAVLLLAGASLLLPILSALYLLLVVMPVGLLRRALRAATAK